MPRVGETKALSPFWQAVDGETVRLYQGHVIDVLRRLPAKSVQMIVTSPPYWGLRDYQVDKRYELGAEKVPDCGLLGDMLLALRDDLTDEEREYVISELLKRGLL